MSLDWDVLSKQDDKTSNAIISLLGSDDAFVKFAESEGQGIIRRDQEDDDKLAKGIQLSVERGVLPADVAVEPIVEIDVQGKTADGVADEILGQLGGTEGKVVVLQGLSGTGKGTTTAKLQQRLPKCETWSNGNVFRSVTLLATTDAEKAGVPFTADRLTREAVASYFERLEFKKFPDGRFDTAIDCFGTSYRVSEIQNTLLKQGSVGSNVPTVAETCQGEVVLFAAKAVQTLTENGHNVLLEGRAQTLNHIRTPHRFTLVIRQPALLGQRRAAQRLMGAAVSELAAATSPADIEAFMRKKLADGF